MWTPQLGSCLLRSFADAACSLDRESPEEPERNGPAFSTDVQLSAYAVDVWRSATISRSLPASARTLAIDSRTEGTDRDVHSPVDAVSSECTIGQRDIQCTRE